MANRTISELEKAVEIIDDMLLAVDTEDNTKSISLKQLKDYAGENKADKDLKNIEIQADAVVNYGTDIETGYRWEIWNSKKLVVYGTTRTAVGNGAIIKLPKVFKTPPVVLTQNTNPTQVDGACQVYNVQQDTFQVYWAFNSTPKIISFQCIGIWNEDKPPMRMQIQPLDLNNFKTDYFKLNEHYINDFLPRNPDLKAFLNNADYWQTPSDRAEVSDVTNITRQEYALNEKVIGGTKGEALYNLYPNNLKRTNGVGEKLITISSYYNNRWTGHTPEQEEAEKVDGQKIQLFYIPLASFLAKI